MIVIEKNLDSSIYCNKPLREYFMRCEKINIKKARYYNNRIILQLLKFISLFEEIRQ